jgi:hypothetical protein
MRSFLFSLPVAGLLVCGALASLASSTLGCSSSSSPTQDAKLRTDGTGTPAGSGGTSPGACGAAPSYVFPLTKMSPDGGVFTKILTDADHLYLVSQTGVFSLPKSGGTVTPLVGQVGQSLPQIGFLNDAWLVGSTLYYELSSKLYSMPASGGTSTPIGTLPQDAGRLLVDATGIYVVTGQIGKPYSLQFLPLAGGSATVLAPLPNDVDEYVVDGGFVYLKDYTTHQISRVPTSGGTPTSLGLTSTGFIGRADFFLDADAIYVSSADGLQRAPKAGGATTSLSTYRESWGAAADGTVYGMGINSLGGTEAPFALWKVSATGGASTVIGCTPDGTTAQGEGLDDAHVYVGVTDASEQSGVVVFAR